MAEIKESAQKNRLEKKLMRSTSPKTRITDEFREQYQRALVLIRERFENGMSNNEIVLQLHERGFKTITGRDWNLPQIYTALAKIRHQSSPEQSLHDR